LVRNYVEYGNYQKFLAVSVVTFGPADAGNEGRVK
jgi:hypothetical protein